MNLMRSEPGAGHRDTDRVDEVARAEVREAIEEERRTSPVELLWVPGSRSRW